MKKLLAAIGILAATALPGYLLAQVQPGDAMPAKNITMKNVSGQGTTLAQAAGKNGLLVMFSCNTCPFVIKNQEPTKKAMQYAAAHQIGMVIINSNEAKRAGDDSYEAMAAYAKEQGYTVPYLVDENSNVADAFGANHTPEIFLFNKDQVLVYKGAMNDNPSDPKGYKTVYINEAIDAMLAGKKVDPATTKSIGCSIKRKS